VKREILCEEPLVAAIPMEHELAQEPDPLSLTEIAKHDHLVYLRNPRPSCADQVLALFRDLGVEPRAVYEVQELQTALGLVASGMGLCLVPASANWMRPDEVVYRPVAEAKAVSPIIMSTRIHDQSTDIVLLRSLIDDIYREWAEERQRVAMTRRFLS
jgi:DNA-binding transcriptional LysR family regulator